MRFSAWGPGVSKPAEHTFGDPCSGLMPVGFKH
eukprot:CAMPEP_0119431810 /NCGR_PEP_ID=MMETSP1335-20130426/46633_1 /TAXON_ID=259385 /ORGANISM="Chrysoculter rhomboideus, Strain RCC1486" /LENGTH=32 /DNA_ID= /DNA_START= /DNA_END= /DNA_ORIENTATION=